MQSLKVLLLNFNYEIIAFICERKAIRLFVRDKVDVISSWPDIEINIGPNRINFPAILKLKYFVKRNYKRLIFSRKLILKRDRYSCSYCGKYLSPGQITVDHILPKSLGGISSFNNCVASCITCNMKKGNRTPEQAGMHLINKPFTPTRFLWFATKQDIWHNDWNLYVKNI